MGKVSKGVACSVSGCKEAAVRSVQLSRAKSAGLSVPDGSRRAYICKQHYKALKKALRDEDKLRRMRWSV